MKTGRKIKLLIKDNAHLFWWVPEEKKENLSADALVEAVLNYGSQESVKQLFEVIGIETVARIFKNNTQGKQRINYLPDVFNYFHLYFQKHVPGYSE